MISDHMLCRVHVTCIDLVAEPMVTSRLTMTVKFGDSSVGISVIVLHVTCIDLVVV